MLASYSCHWPYWCHHHWSLCPTSHLAVFSSWTQKTPAACSWYGSQHGAHPLLIHYRVPLWKNKFFLLLMFGSMQKVAVVHLKWHPNMCGEMRKTTVWLWIGGDCLDQNSFLYWGILRQYKDRSVCVTEWQNTHMLLSACAYFSGWAFTSCTKRTSFLKTCIQHNLANLKSTTST